MRTNEKPGPGAGETPDLLGAAVGPIFGQLDAREQRVLLAILERMAADSYRGWAADETDPAAKEGLLEAAANEDGIADTLEDLDPDHERIGADLHRRFPQLEGLFGTVLDGRPREEQLRLQMAAENGAGELFRSLAEAETDPRARSKLMACAATEKANAGFLAGQLGLD